MGLQLEKGYMLSCLKEDVYSPFFSSHLLFRRCITTFFNCPSVRLTYTRACVSVFFHQFGLLQSDVAHRSTLDGLVVFLGSKLSFECRCEQTIFKKCFVTRYPLH